MQQLCSVQWLNELYGYFEDVARRDPEDEILPESIIQARQIFGGVAGKIAAIPEEFEVFAINGGISTLFASEGKHVRLYCGPESYIYWAEVDGSGIKYSDLVNAPDSEKLAERLQWLQS